MRTSKKNQHYVPKFYLRNFSFCSNQKEIGLYNLINDFWFDRAKLKTQASKKFYYGEDGVIEDKLSEIEGKLATTISEIVDTENLPKKFSNSHFDLLTFIGLTDIRNPVKIEGMKEILSQMKDRLLDLDPKADVNNFVPELSHDELVRHSLFTLKDILPVLSDLDYKLLINQTQNPFITSDFPVIKYNQFLEFKNWKHTKTGFGSVGLQIFIPLTSNLTILFYDKNIYKVGFKKTSVLNLEEKEDINQINNLQFLNCTSTLYFNEFASEHYIKKLLYNSTKYNRANVTKSKNSFMQKEDNYGNIINIPKKKNLMVIDNSELYTNLKIRGIKIHSKGKVQKLDYTLSQLRPQVLQLMNKNNR